MKFVYITCVIKEIMQQQMIVIYMYGEGIKFSGVKNEIWRGRAFYWEIFSDWENKQIIRLRKRGDSFHHLVGKILVPLGILQKTNLLRGSISGKLVKVQMSFFNSVFIPHSNFLPYIYGCLVYL